MKAHEFVSAVQESAPIPDQDHAEQAVRATLAVLGQRLSTEAKDLVAQLPPELADAIPTDGSVERFGLGEFYDRDEAGRELAGRLTAHLGRDDVVVLALPRGGMPVAAHVARALGAAGRARGAQARAPAYRDGRSAVGVRGTVAILVDDGLAIGSTWALREHVDELVCAYTPEPFYAIGQGYRDFCQTEAEEVRSALQGTAGAQESER